MSDTLAQQSFATVVSPKKPDHIVRFALVLLGVAAALVILGAAFPEWFTGSLTHFGSGTP